MNIIKVDGFPEITINIVDVKDPVVSGVYFLFDQHGKAIYVGESKDVYRRIRNHKNNPKIRFNYFSYLQYETRAQRLQMEAYYVHHLKPKHNLRHNPDWMALCVKAYDYLYKIGRDKEFPKAAWPSVDRVDPVLKEMGIANPFKRL